jgi:hypothetical protein
MADKKNINHLTDLNATLEKIVVDLVDIYWEMKPKKNASDSELSEFSTLARIAGERGKIAMKAIDELRFLMDLRDKKKPDNNADTLSDEEIKLILDYRKKKKCS